MAGNNEIVATSSEGYTRLDDARRSAEENFPEDSILETTEEEA